MSWIRIFLIPFSARKRPIVSAICSVCPYMLLNAMTTPSSVSYLLHLSYLAMMSLMCDRQMGPWVAQSMFKGSVPSFFSAVWAGKPYLPTILE